MEGILDGGYLNDSNSFSRDRLIFLFSFQRVSEALMKSGSKVTELQFLTFHVSFPKCILKKNFPPMSGYEDLELAPDEEQAEDLHMDTTPDEIGLASIHSPVERPTGSFIKAEAE